MVRKTVKFAPFTHMFISKGISLKFPPFSLISFLLRGGLAQSLFQVKTMNNHLLSKKRTGQYSKVIFTLITERCTLMHCQRYSLKLSSCKDWQFLQKEPQINRTIKKFRDFPVRTTSSV